MDEVTVRVSPFEVLHPNQRWLPESQELAQTDYDKLLPPLVLKVRQAVHDWRESGYQGASETTRALLHFWFFQDHPFGEGLFNFYFSQREAIESIIYLYEGAKARDKYDLLRYDSSGRVSHGMFDETWTRYVVKMATGTGKTKVLGLALVWSYFHKLYEAESPLSQNFLVIAPNIIVLNRLRKDFDGLRMFFVEPFLPEDGYTGCNWRTDFQPTLHIQDEVKPISESGNIFLTNIHRVYLHEEGEPSTEEFFLGKKPKPDADTSKGLDLEKVLRSDKIKDLMVLNDEAHHIHDPSLQWFKSIEDIHNQLKLKFETGLSAQLDFTATPRKNSGAIFVQAIVDYPLVEAITQNVVKKPVLPDIESRDKLIERDSTNVIERYQDHIHLGYIEWEKQYKELGHTHTPILFVMANDTKEADEIAEHLQSSYSLLNNRVLTIHTKRNGELLGETSTSKKVREELDELRKAADSIDKPDSPYRAVVSVLVLREGWDVKNVTTIVGLRPYNAKSNILPEQTLGRGLRKMFDLDVPETLVVVGTNGFIEFVEGLKTEGVTFDYQPMGGDTGTKSALIVEVDRESDKDLEALDIPYPILSPRVYREYKDLNRIDVRDLPAPGIDLKKYSADEIREINFMDWEGKYSHTAFLDHVHPDYRNVIGFYTERILKDTKLISGFNILYPRVQQFITEHLFSEVVDPANPNVLRNLIRPEVNKALKDIFINAINELTIAERQTGEIRQFNRLTDARPFVTGEQPFLFSDKTVFNKVIGDNDFERRFAAALNRWKDVAAFAKNHPGVGFHMEYLAENGNIRDYYPDFFAKLTDGSIWVVETKGREDLNDLRKINRLRQWCEDVNELQEENTYGWLYVPQEQWEQYAKNMQSFASAVKTFTEVLKKIEKNITDPWAELKQGADMSSFGDPVEYQRQVREDRDVYGKEKDTK